MRDRVSLMSKEEWKVYYEANVDSMKKYMEVSIYLDLHGDDLLMPVSTQISSKNGSNATK